MHASVAEKKLPCNDNEGYIAIRQTDFYRSGISTPNLNKML